MSGQNSNNQRPILKCKEKIKGKGVLMGMLDLLLIYINIYSLFKKIEVGRRYIWKFSYFYFSSIMVIFQLEC